MKFDRVLAWSELTDTELEMVYGGSVGVGASESAATTERLHSFGIICDISIFSANLDLIPIVNIADCVNQTCANNN
jgi:hypothetical protein